MTFEQFRDEAFDIALSLGCTAAETYYVQDNAFQAQALDGELESYTVSQTGGLGLRVQYNGRNGYAYTEQLDGVRQLVERAVDNARVSESTDEHPMMGKCSYQTVVQPKDPALALTERQKIDLALDLERQALKADARVTKVESAAVITGSTVTRIDNTLGLSAQREEGYSISYVSPILEQDGQVHDGAAFRIRDKVLDTAGCAAEAVQEAARQFGAGSVPAGTYSVVFRYDAAADLLASFCSMFSADAAQKGLSLLAGKEGETIAAPIVTVMDDPFYKDFPRAFDDEGVPSVTKAVVEKGVLKTLLHNLKTARKAGVESTSNGGRRSPASPVGVAPSNFYIVAGQTPLEGLLEQLGDGLFITEVSGLHAGVNTVSGDFSLLARGMRVESGKCTVPVEQITVAGHFLQLMQNITAIGSDLTFGIPGGANVASPSLLVQKVKVAGK